MEAESLDSLLDTMANVVGILVVLVAVTQMSLGDAVERIREQAGERAAATPDDLARVVGEREEIETRLETVRSQIERYAAAPTAGLVVADAGPLLDAYEALAGQSVAAGDLPSDLEIENDRVAVARLEGEVREQTGERERLLAILAEPQAKAESRIIRLPDPRPVPEGLDRVFFLCRGAAVHVIDLDALEEALLGGIQDATGAFERQITLERDDFPWIVNHFAKESVGDQGYRWVFDSPDPTRFLAELVPTEAVAPGDPEPSLGRGQTRFEARLDALDPRRQYVRFFVWPDSFDVYLTARRLAEDRGLRVGWTEVRAERNLQFDVLRAARPGRRLLD